MRANFVHVPISSSVSGIRVLIPQRSTANPFEWTPCPRRALPRLLLYYELVRLPCRHTSSSPFLGLLEASFWERHGSPTFRCKPLDDLLWTQTPACRDTLTMTHAAMLASRENNLWPNATTKISGLNTFTCVMADHPPSLWLHVIRYLLTCKVLFRPGG